MIRFRRQNHATSFCLMKNGSTVIPAVNAEIITIAKEKSLFQEGVPVANMMNQQRRIRSFITAGCQLPMLSESCIPSVATRIFQPIKLPRMNASAK